MLDFEKIEEMTILVMGLDQTLIFENGIVVNQENFGEFITSIFDT